MRVGWYRSWRKIILVCVIKKKNRHFGQICTVSRDSGRPCEAFIPFHVIGELWCVRWGHRQGRYERRLMQGSGSLIEQTVLPTIPEVEILAETVPPPQVTLGNLVRLDLYIDSYHDF